MQSRQSPPHLPASFTSALFSDCSEFNLVVRVDGVGDNVYAGAGVDRG